MLRVCVRMFQRFSCCLVDNDKNLLVLVDSHKGYMYYQMIYNSQLLSKSAEPSIRHVFFQSQILVLLRKRDSLIRFLKS